MKVFEDLAASFVKFWESCAATVYTMKDVISDV